MKLYDQIFDVVKQFKKLFSPGPVTNADVSGSITLEGETYVIDLAGHKWTNSGNAVVLATGSLYVYDSVGGGSIETSANDAINMGNGTAKFENITIKGGGDGMDAIYCDGGNLTVINCTLSAPKAGINVANGSESSDSSARSVVTVNGGKFANYSGTKDSQGRNCAIEIRNNADEITLTGNITFENNKIISKKTNTKSIKDSITTSGTITSDSDVADYVTATISFGSTTPVDPNPGVTNPDLIAGDVNGDKSLNGKDALQLRRYITGGWDLTVIEQLLDINCDENVNGKDVPSSLSQVSVTLTLALISISPLFVTVNVLLVVSPGFQPSGLTNSSSAIDSYLAVSNKFSKSIIEL